MTACFISLNSRSRLFCFASKLCKVVTLLAVVVIFRFLVPNAENMSSHSHIAQSPSRVLSLVELLRERAERQPQQRAFTFLIDGDVEGSSLTYMEIDQQARAIAASLQCDGLEGERALLLYPPGLAFVAAFYGVLYAGVTAVTAPLPLPSRRARTLPRLEAVARDAQPKVALTTSEAMPEIEKAISSSAELRSMRWVM